MNFYRLFKCPGCQLRASAPFFDDLRDQVGNQPQVVAVKCPRCGKTMTEET